MDWHIPAIGGLWLSCSAIRALDNRGILDEELEFGLRAAYFEARAVAGRG